MLDAYIYGGLRTPFGRHGGVLAHVRADDLAAGVLRELLHRGPFQASDVEDVLLGCSNQSGEDSRNVARHALLVAGFPPEVPGQTVNRLCASGLAAVLDAARAVSAGEGELYLAGGVENMSRAPFVLGKAENAFSREAKIFDTTLGARFPNPTLVERYGTHTMPETGDNVAAGCGITREAADVFAWRSQRLYQGAKASGFFEGELVTVTVGGRAKMPAVLVCEDEHPRADVSLQGLAKLKALFPNGVVTAGNASGINDGAAALWVGNASIGLKRDAKPLARILAGAASGVEPALMGIGPVTAIQKALLRAGLSLSQMDVIEINEAFAPQVLGCLKGLGIAFDDSRVNPNGGAIAVGHPLGASGGRLALTAVRQLHRIQGRYAVVSLCVGVGQGLALVLQRV